MNLTTDTKLFLGIGIITVVLVAVASIMLTRPKEGPKLNNDQSVDKTILIRPDSANQSTDSAKLTLVEFADFQCPSCGTVNPMVEDLLKRYSGKLNYVFRHFPLPQHGNAFVAALASEVAGDQNKFWEMSSMLFTNQSDWSEEKNPSKIFESYAKELGLDVNKFKSGMSKRLHKDKIERDTSDGKSLGVSSTPTFFLNGQRMSNFADIEVIIKSEIDKKSN